jgi:cytochrome c553
MQPPLPAPTSLPTASTATAPKAKQFRPFRALPAATRPYLEETLKAFKAGTKQATIMTQLAKGYTDEELAILADYFARQR